jgi:hypothetical protein
MEITTQILEDLANSIATWCGEHPQGIAEDQDQGLFMRYRGGLLDITYRERICSLHVDRLSPQLAASIEHGLNLWLQEYAERKNIVLSSCPVRRDGCWFLGIAEG